MIDEGKYGEPWEVAESDAHTGQIATCHGEEPGWKEIWTPRWGDHTRSQSANAARIVACVNACASIPDPAALVEAARRVVSNGLHKNTDLTSEAQEDLRDLRTALNPEDRYRG